MIRAIVVCLVALVSGGCVFTDAVWRDAGREEYRFRGIVGYVTVDEHGEGRGVVLRYDLLKMIGESEARYVVLPADGSWRVTPAMALTELEGTPPLTLFAEVEGEPTKRETIVGAIERSRTSRATGDRWRWSRRLPARFVAAPSWQGMGLSQNANVYANYYWPPDLPPRRTGVATAQFVDIEGQKRVHRYRAELHEPAPRWLAAPFFVRRPSGERAAAKFGATLVTPFAAVADGFLFVVAPWVYTDYRVRRVCR